MPLPECALQRCVETRVCGCCGEPMRAKGNAKGVNESFTCRCSACVCRSCLCSNMEPSCVAALSAAVDHVSASALNSLVMEVEQLTRENQELAQQALQYRRGELWMRAVITAALQDLRRGDLESVEGRLLQGDMYSGRGR